LQEQAVRFGWWNESIDGPLWMAHFRWPSVRGG
jgi:hypothetical protein